jgi:hypothetical protein
MFLGLQGRRWRCLLGDECGGLRVGADTSWCFVSLVLWAGDRLL